MPSVFFISLMSASSWGGSEELWYRTALLASKQGWKVTVAVYHWKEKEQRMKVLENAGATIHYLPNKGRSKKNLVERIQNKISKSRVKSVIQNLPFKDHDLTMVNMGAFEITMPSWRGLPSLLDQYIVLYHNYKEAEVFSGSHKAAIQDLANNSLLNLFASRRIAEVLENNSGILVPRSEVLFNPLSFERPASPTPFPPLIDGAYRFVMLAALEVDRKAQDVLIEALSTPEWKSRNWTLHLYGLGRDAKTLEQLINSRGLQSKIFLEGHTDNVQSVLANAHLLLQITHQDAMPLSVMEAMSVARPIMVSKIGDMPYWVKEDENGWIVNQASISLIRNKLEWAWQKRDSWEAMGRISYEMIQENFPASPEKKLLNQMESVLR